MKKIVLTGGGSGGHFFPLLAIVEKIIKLTPSTEEDEWKIIYMGERNKNTEVLEKLGVKIVTITTSKIRRYFSLKNILEIPKFLFGLIQAWIKLYFIMPDLIFSKGGPGSLPVVLAGAFYMIPIIIHESDAVPSLTTKIAARFARKIETSFVSTSTYLIKQENKINITGNPIRESILNHKIDTQEAKEKLGFTNDLPLLFVLGGSQGAKRLNNFIFDNFEELLHKFQILHQVGENNWEGSKLIVASLTKEISSLYSSRYKMVSFLSEREIATALSACDLVLSRAGAGAIFEIAAFGKPSILIPLPESAQDHQRINAYEYANTGAAMVLEEKNLEMSTFSLLADKIQEPNKYKQMREAALGFSKTNAADLIITDMVSILKNEK